MESTEVEQNDKRIVEMESARETHRENLENNGKTLNPAPEMASTQLSHMIYTLGCVDRDLATWKTKADVLQSNPESNDRGESAEQEVNSLHRKPLDASAGLVHDIFFDRKMDELASRLHDLVKDFQKEAESLHSLPSQSATAIPRPPTPERPPAVKQRGPWQTVFVLDPTQTPPRSSSPAVGYPPTRIVHSECLPEEKECTVENWRDFLPFIDPENPQPEGFGVFEIRDEEQLTQLPITFVHYDYEGHVFCINSPYLQKQIRRFVDVERYADVSLSTTYMKIRRPFASIFHHLEAIKNAILVDAEATESDKNYFKALYHFFVSGPGQKPFGDIRTLLHEHLVFYVQLWALFRPKDFVVCKDPFGNYVVSQIVSINWEEEKRPQNVVRYRWHLTLSRIAWSGRGYQRYVTKEMCESFKGSKRIQELPIYPLRYHSDPGKTADLARKYSKKWRSFCNDPPQVKTYHGSALLLRSPEPFSRRPEEKIGFSADRTIMLNASVIVDPDARTKVRMQATIDKYSLIGDPQFFEPGIDPPPKDIDEENLGEDEFLICPMSIAVFNLDDNAWYSVDLLKLKDRIWRPQTFDRLVFDPEKKHVLRHLAGSNAKGRDRYSRDAIEGKGVGTVLLLHGPPGVGKTMTAEVLSEYTRKPLLKVHLGKVANHENWEQALEQIFYTAESWEAILLIDEAEIVLEKRTFEGMTRNSWISVFLRKLEYYKGLIILTTNMVNNIDEAFESRISYPVHFPELSREDRETIWRDFIQEISMLPFYKKDLLSAVDKWAEAEINGRQIRNVISLAENLASSKELGGILKPERIDNILNVTVEFSFHNRKTAAKKKKDQFSYN